MNSHDPVAVIGLGQMGSRIAARLLAQGWHVRVFNRTSGPAQALGQRGATVSSSAAEAVVGAKVVITSLRGDEAVQAMTDSFIDSMSPGALHVGTSTVAPELALALERRHIARGTHFLSVPVQGRPEAVEAGQLIAWASGPRAAFDEVEGLLRTLAAAVHWVGPSVGAGPSVKLAVNMLMFANIELLAETFDYLRRCGVDPGPVGNVLTATVFATPLFKAIVGGLAGDHGSTGTNIHGSLRDLDMLVSHASEIHAAMPAACAVRHQYAVAVERGHGHLAQTAVLLALQDSANVAGNGV